MRECPHDLIGVREQRVSDVFVFELDRVRQSFAVGVFDVERYQLSIEWYAHVPCLSAFLCTCTLHSIGTSGILL